jgi:hypothetical protein
MIGPITTPKPKIPSTMPWCFLAKISSKMDCVSGVDGAPQAPCMMRQKTKVSKELDRPHMRVAAVNPVMLTIITLRIPKRDASQPDIGVAMAVAKMLKVTTQAISSAVADIVPCICGNTVATINKVVPYSVVVMINETRMASLRTVESVGRGASARVTDALREAPRSDSARLIDCA